MGDEQEEKTTPRGQERRASARLPVEMWVEEITDGSQVFRRAGNLSRGGLYLDHTIPVPVGTRVRLRFTLPGDSNAITVTGEVVSISAKDALGMGVKFVEVSDDDRGRVEAYLSRAATPMP
jgi:uncharacterized protein (TIGR02266 family)